LHFYAFVVYPIVYCVRGSCYQSVTLA